VTGTNIYSVMTSWQGVVRRYLDLVEWGFPV